MTVAGRKKRYLSWLATCEQAIVLPRRVSRQGGVILAVLVTVNFVMQSDWTPMAGGTIRGCVAIGVRS